MKRGETLILKIDDYAFGGKGISKIETEKGKFVVFVEHGIPGQTVEALVIKSRKNHAECALRKVIQRSPDEVEVPYQPISGAPYITLPIAIQHQNKLHAVVELFRRIAGVQEVEKKFDILIASPETHFYRNKVEYSFSSIRFDPETGTDIDDDFALGYKSRGTWWKVENLEKPGGLFDEEFEALVPEIREFLKCTGLPAWHPPKKTGFFKHIVVRKSFAQDKLLVNLVTSSEGVQDFNQGIFTGFLLERLGRRFAGVQHTVNDEKSDRDKISEGNTLLLWGSHFVTERLLGLEFNISMESFFQTNPHCAEKLYSKAVDYAMEMPPSAGEILLDLFCGTGTIGQIFAKKIPGLQIVGVDIVAEAIRDAEKNAKRNGSSNIRFFADDVGKFLSNHPEYSGAIHTIVLDPPRAGIAPKSLRKVIALGARQIVYISCNPATQARDTKELTEAGYELVKFSIVDQFPHTAHVETVALFRRNQ